MKGVSVISMPEKPAAAILRAILRLGDKDFDFNMLIDNPMSFPAFEERFLSVRKPGRF